SPLPSPLPSPRRDDDPNPNISPQEELDFSILFDYDYSQPVAEEPTPSHKIISPPTGVTYPHDDVSDYGLKPYPFALSSLSADHMGRYGQPDSIGSKCYLDPFKAAGPPTLSPRIEITPSYELIHSGGPFSSRDTDLLVEHQSSSATASPRFTLPVPGFESYREPLCLSPPSSGSSASFISETNFSPYTSPCVSPNNGPSDDLCPQFQNTHAHYSPRTSPIMSPQATVVEDTCLGPRSPSPHPNSRSSSPGAKRRYSCTELYGSQHPHSSPRQSRTPSPQASPHISLGEDGATVTYTQLSTSSSLMDAMNNLTTDPSCGVPTKIWRTTPDPSPLASHKASMPCHVLQPIEYIGSCEQENRRNPPPDSILLVPPSWPKQLMPPIPIYNCVNGLFSCQLHGYVDHKPLGLQIFIGTADERILKPHAFYQVHRITGKTVTTTSFEKIIGNTKVLEIPLEPKNNMKATIDCAGILKLRNADIELRKGETDIGRKNTRVRLVFRVHIPESSGRIVSLQVASNPIECSQRSAHELPMVERQDVDTCLVYGGQQMILTGQNFTAESKVIFTEKTPDGQQVWEMEATVDKDKSQSNMLFVEIPEYRNKHIRVPVKVNFYVINGKRKKSQPQHFTYHPVPSIKTEPIDDYNPSLICNTVHSGLRTVTQPYYSHHTMASESPSCLVATMASCQQLHSNLSSPESQYPSQNPGAIIYQRSKSLSPSHLGYQQSNLMGTQVSIPDVHRSVLVHTGSPSQSSAMLHHSPANQPSSPVIHCSPTANHQMRCESHQEFQHIMCSENFTSSGVRPHQPQVNQAQRLSPSSYPTVIQQQRTAKNGPPVNDQKEVVSAGVTVKQEQNLDQAYLDDGKQYMFYKMLFSPQFGL
uniref:Nuclear factor of activated T cells 2 n=2 Tax=Pseudonaja textilis TaxID=8673 RepID=A0A670Y117_PSETE